VHLLPRYIRVLRNARAGKQDEGVAEAQSELHRAQQDSQLMDRIKRDMAHLTARAAEIRERNGFEEIMTRLVQSERPQSHGHGRSI
jgi:hypothetical protein